MKYITLLKNEPFLRYRQFKKGTFLKKSGFFIKLFLNTFSPKRTFCYPTTFFESLITHKRFVFEESYISYDKRQKSCTLIVVLVKCLYLTSPTFNSSAKSNRLFLLQRRKYEVTCCMIAFMIQNVRWQCIGQHGTHAAWENQSYGWGKTKNGLHTLNIAQNIVKCQNFATASMQKNMTDIHFHILVNGCTLSTVTLHLIVEVVVGRPIC